VNFIVTQHSTLNTQHFKKSEAAMKTIFAVLLLMAGGMAALGQPLPPDTMWTLIYGGHEDEYGSCICQTPDEGYIVAGDSAYFLWFECSKINIVKVNDAGLVEWNKTYPNMGDIIEYHGSYIIQTTDNNLILLGSFYYHSFYLMKLDLSGDSLWCKNYTSGEFPSCVKNTADSGFIILGLTDGFTLGENDIYILKTDEQGDSLWARQYGGNDHEYASDIHQTTDGGYIILGSTYSFGAGGLDVYVIKTDFYGDTLWTKTLGGSSHETGRSIEITADNHYAILAHLDYIYNGCKAIIYELDEAGNTLAEHPVGDSVTWVINMQKTYDNGFIINGTVYNSTWPDMKIMKIDSSFNSVWSFIYGGDLGDYSACIRQTADSAYSALGNPLGSFSNSRDIILLKLSPEPVSYVSYAPIPKSHILSLKLSPNPFNAETVISFDLPASRDIALEAFDLAGRKIETIAAGEYPAGHHTAKFAGENLPSGVYFIRLQADGEVRTQKCVLLK